MHAADYASQRQRLEVRLGSSPGSADAKAHWLWGKRYVDELVQRKHDANDDGDFADSDEVHYALQDANWRVTAIADPSLSNNAIDERYEYTAYGERTILNGHNDSEGSNFSDDTDGSDYAFRIGHQGLFHDATTGLVYNRNRMLHPALGRFTTRDPLGYVGVLNLYAYLSSTPRSTIDPLGLASRQEITETYNALREMDFKNTLARELTARELGVTLREVKRGLAPPINRRTTSFCAVCHGHPARDDLANLAAPGFSSPPLFGKRGSVNQREAAAALASGDDTVCCGGKTYPIEQARGKCCVNGKLVPRRQVPLNVGEFGGKFGVSGIAGKTFGNLNVGLTANTVGQLTLDLSAQGKVGPSGGGGLGLMGGFAGRFGLQRGSSPIVSTSTQDIYKGGASIGAGGMGSLALTKGPQGTINAGSVALGGGPMRGGAGGFVVAADQGTFSLSTPAIFGPDCW